MDRITKTKKFYDYLWLRAENELPLTINPHFKKMQEVIPEPMVRGSKGIEIGSGNGNDSYYMAKNNPLVKIVSLDLSDGIYMAKKLTENCDNIALLKASALRLPLKNNIFDFAYSFGVLHHTSDPREGLKEISRVIKTGAPAYLYLYEDHSENILKLLAIKIIIFLRYWTTKLPPRALFIFSFILSPFIVIFFTYPSKIFSKFEFTRKLAENMPFNFGTNLFSLTGDLYDRLGVPVEYRYSRQQVDDLFTESGFSNISITRLKKTAGWVAWGYKK